MKIGFIGLGIMGSRMAMNIDKAGYPLFIFNRTASRMDAFESTSIRKCSSAAEIANSCDIVITMLSTPEAVQEVAMGENGFLGEMSAGKVWIDCSTVNPSFSKQMAEISEGLGFNFLDAPVAGSLKPAENAELVFLVGGKKSIVKYCTPLLKTMGKKVIHGGDSGQGSALKLVNNLVMGISMYAVTEGLLLGESLGIDKKEILNLLDGSPIAAPMISLKKEKILANNLEAEFPLQWLRKDLQLAAQTAYEQGISLPATNSIKEIFGFAEQAGFGEKDFTAIYFFLSGLKASKNEE
ncbi:MAG: NAD(P)-dependent oxidoreductase [Bacteroidales bacterium]|nr:NAD(P)-dependent oxidoreductase [Bacteroidales bacterium]MCF8405907.1 NAD(P)-dependent oxidoreductase [Bacteroidales bacterium]